MKRGDFEQDLSIANFMQDQTLTHIRANQLKNAFCNSWLQKGPDSLKAEHQHFFSPSLHIAQ